MSHNCSSSDPVAALQSEVQTLKARVAELEDHARSMQSEFAAFIDETSQRLAKLDHAAGIETAPPSQYTIRRKG